MGPSYGETARHHSMPGRLRRIPGATGVPIPLPVFPGEAGRHSFESSRFLGRLSVDDSENARPTEVRSEPTRREVVDAVTVPVERVDRLVPPEPVIAQAERGQLPRVVHEDDLL